MSVNDWYSYQPGFTFKSDAGIKRNIETELWWSPFVDPDDITVTVDNGVATLASAVESWKAVSTAREDAD